MNDATKMAFAREFKKGDRTLTALAKQFGISRLQARLWIYMLAMTADENIALAPKRRGPKPKIKTGGEDDTKRS